MKRKLLIVLLLPLLAMFLSTARGQTNEEDPKLLAELVELSRKIYEAGLSGDQEFLSQHIASDFAENDDWGEFRNSYRSVLYDVRAGEKFTHEIVEAHVRQRADVAVLSYRWVFKFHREGQEFVRILGVTDVFHRHKGVWQLFATHRDFSGQDFPVLAGKAQTPTGDRLEKIVKFLTTSAAMRQHKATFTGEFIPIPDLLVRKLETWLFLHRFYIVRMKRSFDISSRDSNLLIVVDEKSNEVVSYLWDFALEQMPEAFKNILTPYPLSSELRFAVLPLKILGDLLLSLDPDDDRSVGNRVGSINANDKMFSAELIYDYSPRFILQVENKNGKFGRLSIIRPERR